MAEDISSKLTSLSLRDTEECQNPTKDEIDTWEDAFDEKGNALGESKLVAPGGKTNYNYYSMGSQDLPSTQELKPVKPSVAKLYNWVLEAHDFKPSLKTADLVAGLQGFKSSAYAIKWVDDTHALVIFATEELAEQASTVSYAVFRLRPLCEGADLSIRVAEKCADSLRPCQEKPKTTSSVARRMISNALGVKIAVSKDKLDEERKAMQRAKEEKKAASKRKDYWADDL